MLLTSEGFRPAAGVKAVLERVEEAGYEQMATERDPVAQGRCTSPSPRLGRRAVTWPLARGQVVRAAIGLDEPKLFVIVSNNRRNRSLGDVLGARLTTSAKPSIPSVVELEAEVLTGRVV